MSRELTVLNRRRTMCLIMGALAFPFATRTAAMSIPARRLRLYNPHTGETFDGAYRDERGPVPSAMADLSEFMRDFHAAATMPVDIGVIDFLASVMDAVGVSAATILSAYRTPETNAMLARTTFGVAEHSQHLYARALDIQIGNKLTEAVLAARAMQRGGVGWYPASGFMHIDSGPVRNWDLDETGLRALLFDGRRPRLDTKPQYPAPLRGVGLGPELQHSGNLLLGLEQSGRVLPGLEQSGRFLR
jgi:uncharacterized protein YcbK (DUF882 family)